MATSVELPTKREYDSDSGDEVAASKKAKAVVTEEEDSSDDESMSERSVPDDEFMPDRDSESESDDEFEKLLRGEALEDNMLKDRITSFLEDSYGYKYTQYVNEKIRFALKLGILSRHNEEFIEDAMTYLNRLLQEYS